MDYRKISNKVKKIVNEFEDGQYFFDENEMLISKKGILSSRFWEYPVEFRHYISVFPNKYLDPILLTDKTLVKALISDYKKEIENPKTTETVLLRWLKTGNREVIIGSVLLNYTFGHHQAFLFEEFSLGTTFRPDFLLLGTSSDGFSMVFVELEAIYGRLKLGDGNFGEVIRKGLNQIEDWKKYLENHYSSFKVELEKHLKDGDTLPKELQYYNANRIHYVIIAGRRADFNEKLRDRKLSLEKDGIRLLHYDNLIDYTELFMNEKTNMY